MRFTLLFTFLFLSINTVLLSQTILQEDFELGNLPNTWTLDSNQPSVGWEVATAANLSSSNVNIPNNGSGFIAASNDDLYDDTTALTNIADEDRLISPLIDLSTYSTITLQFDYLQPGFFGSDGSVEVSLDGGNSWTEIQQLAATSTWQTTTIDLSSYSNDTILLSFKHNDNGQWAGAFAVDNIHVFAPIMDNISLQMLRIDEYVAVGSILVEGELTNEGVNTISSFDINYAIDGGTTVTSSIININIMSGNNFSFTHTVPANFSTAQNYQLKVWTSNVNGNTDGDNTNDTLTTIVKVLSSIPAKQVILENYTGAWCAQCPDGIATMAQILNTQTNVLGVNIHNGDAMATNEGSDLTQAFITGFPQGLVDRVLFNDSLHLQPSEWQQNLNLQLAARVPLAVSIVGGNYAPENNELSVTVQADILGRMTGDYRFNLWVIEDNVVGLGTGYDQANAFNTQSGHPFFGAGDPILAFSHDRTLRGMAGGAWGSVNSLPSSMNDGEVYTKKFNFTLPTDANPNNVKVIGLVQQYDPNETTKRSIINAAEAVLLSLTPPVSTNEVTATSIKEITVYPNPTTDMVQIQLELSENTDTRIELLSLQGQTLAVLSNGFRNQGIHTIHGTISDNISNGLYLIRIVANQQQLVKKITVLR